MLYDVAIIGGSYAGLAAAMPLVRARRKVLIIDAGERRNRFSDYSHNFVTQDGTKASDIFELAKKQVFAYDTAAWCTGRVNAVKKNEQQFWVQLEDGQVFESRKVILATGVTDQLPEISGFKERWGDTIFHCPYCHGYELNLGKIGMLVDSEPASHMACIIAEWGEVSYIVKDFELSEEIRARLKNKGRIIDNASIESITGKCDVQLSNGERLQLDALFADTRAIINQPWIKVLGIEIAQNEMGEIIKTNSRKETCLSGVFACGDAGSSGSSVALAIGDGTTAGFTVHRALVADD